MTAAPVTSITDEQILELERLAESIRGWNMPEAFQMAEEGVHPDEWEWYVGAIDEDDNQYPLMRVDAYQYDSGDSELLARYYAACNRAAIQGLIARLRAAEVDAKRYRWWRDRAGVIQDGNGYTTWVLASGSEMYELERNETDQAIDAALERKQ